MRAKFRYLIRVAKATASDPRLPRPLRWALKVGLAIKAVPVPDLGVDEVILVIVGGLLMTVYRPTFRLILAEQKELGS